MPKVLVDLLFFTGTRGGTESYTRNLYLALNDLDHDLTFIAYAPSGSAAKIRAWFPGEVIDSGIDTDNRAKWALAELFRVGRVARRVGADAIHSPANLAPVRSRIPLLLTLHDMIVFRFPQYVDGPQGPLLRALIRGAARGATRIVTDSVGSKDDIVELTSVPGGRIDVVQLAGPPVVDASEHEERDPRLVFALGNRLPHKNFEGLIRALALIPPDIRPRLVLTGGREDDPLTPVVAEVGLEEWVTLLGWVEREEVDTLFSTAGVVAVPSLIEGFGLPVLEAMARGCPVACSDIGVLREVAGDSAEYFDPRDYQSIADALMAVLSSPERRAQMALQSTARAREFSWERTAQQTLVTLERTIAGDRS